MTFSSPKKLLVPHQFGPLTRFPPSPEIPLTVHQRLCGGLFGDGTLDFVRSTDKTGTLVSVRYRERQSRVHEDWVKNQQSGLAPFTDGLKKPEATRDKKGYWFLESRTSRTPLFLPYGYEFYEHVEIDGRWKARKRVPVTSGELLDNPLSVSAWIAGDGRPKSNGDFTLCTQGFTYEENLFLAEIFQQNFGIQCQVVVYSNGKNYYPELYFHRAEARKLGALCDPVIASLQSLKHRFLFA